MGTAMRELRTAVMVLLEVSWQDTNGTAHSVPARMEDKSTSGACIRIKAPIATGVKIVVRSRTEEFSGTCKYCRSEGWEYIIGIQRDTAQESEPKGRFGAPPPKGSGAVDAAVMASKMQLGTQGLENNRSHIPPAVRALNDHADHASATPFRTTEIGHTETAASGHGTDSRESSRISRHEQFAIRRRARLRKNEPATGKEVRRERKSMGRNWLERTPWSSKQGSPETGAGHNENGNAPGTITDMTLNIKESPGTSHSMPRPAFELDQTASFQIDLLPMQEIYSAACVLAPLKGYSVHKVVDMVHSEHIRGLSTDLKRAAVLMALDAAGVTLEQIQQDAKARQDALDRYEAEQTRQADAEWARRNEENEQIQAEMERVKAHYMARINRNLEAVAREKSTFNDWLALKKQESESMSEAVSLCAKSAAKAPAAPLAMAAAADSISKTS
jgi:hypothetical protein